MMILHQHICETMAKQMLKYVDQSIVMETI